MRDIYRLGREQFLAQIEAYLAAQDFRTFWCEDFPAQAQEVE